MPESSSDRVTESNIRNIRKWIFRALVAASVVWGTFSAAAVFAVRYDLLPETAPADEVKSRGVSLDEARDWPKLPVSDWRDVLSPDSIMTYASADTALARLLSTDGQRESQRSVALQLLWDPATQGAIWVAHIATPACNCPYERAERWNYGRLVMNPRTGRPIGRYLRPSIESRDMMQLMITTDPESRDGG